jgi:anaerobic selenocysteine-containing dehydrogenase
MRQQSYPLVLITGKSLHFLNSSYAHSSRHLKAEGEQPQLEIHPADAKRRGLKSRSRVRVFNEQGEVIVQCSISDKVRQGVVAIPFGIYSERRGK